MAAPGSVLSSDKINLEKINFLLVDDNAQCLDIMAHVVAGFGARNVVKCSSVAEAREVLQRNVIDFILTDAQMPDEDGYQLVEWVRRHGSETNRFVPAIVITGHTRLSQITRARDCGAHFTIAKPVTPKVVLERIFWVGRDERMFIDSESYCGPDRRFKREGPPPGMTGRRAEDLDTDVGDASGPNMSQEMIDSLMKPSKVAL
jgi:CheY-like chemotaxis protein